jgi:hypothetical protein
MVGGAGGCPALRRRGDVLVPFLAERFGATVSIGTSGCAMATWPAIEDPGSAL